MSIDDFFSNASQQEPDTQQEVGFGIPSYLIGANNHQVASGASAIESVSDIGRFAVSAVARAVTSVYNIVPEAINWMGGHVDTLDTYDVISKFDNNLADYYQANHGSIDLVGDIAASFIPGMAGVKVLNYGQKALAAASAGKTGFNMAAHIGLLPTYANKLGFAAGKEMAAVSQSFSLLNANVIKSVAAGYAQSALESAAFMGASQIAMSKSPLFEKQDASDIFWNSVWGGAVGAGINGSLAAARTYGAVKSGIKAADRLINPGSLFTATEETLSSSNKLVIALHDINHPPTPPVGESEAITNAFARKVTDRQAVLTNNIRSEVHRITGDEEIANLFTDSIVQAPYEVAIGNVQDIANIQRAGITRLTPFEKLVKKQPELEASKAISYVSLRGENALQVSHDAPAVLSLADTVPNAKAVDQAISKYKFKPNTVWSPVVAGDHLEVEARNIWAQKLDKLPETVSANDLPLLERLYADGAPSFKLTNGTEIAQSDMLDYLKSVKTKQAYLLAESFPDMTTEEIAKRINVSTKLLENEAQKSNQLADWIATDYSKLVADKSYTTPRYLKLVYNVQDKMDENGFVMDAITHAKAQQKELRQAISISAAQYLGAANDMLPAAIGDNVILASSRMGPGGGFTGIMNENYGTMGAVSQQIGAVSNKEKALRAAAVEEKFFPQAYQILNDQVAQDDIIKAVNLMRGSPERFIYNADDGVLRMRKVQAAIDKADGSSPELLDLNSPQELVIKSDSAKQFLQDWIAHNDTKLESGMARNSYSLGTAGQDMRGTFYIPPPDPKDYPFFAMVIDPTVTGTGHVRMIHAADQQKLELLASKVNQQSGLKVIFKNQSEDFHKAMQDYEYGLGINENYIDSALARTGASAPYFPETDAKKILMDMISWRKKADIADYREWVKLKYSPEIDTLNQLAAAHDNLAGSIKGYAGKYAGDQTANPYRDYVKTMLDVSRKDEYPIWTPLNRLLEKGVSSLYAKLQDAVATEPAAAELDRVQGMLKEAGISANFTDPATMLLANHTAPRPVLEEFIRKANSALSFLMLRSDPLNAMNNGVGHTILYGTETRDLIRNISKGNTEAAGELAKISKLDIPGKELGSIMSPSKLATEAYSGYAKMLAGNEDMKQLEVFFRQHGWLPSLLDQERTIMNAATLKGIESPGELAKRMGQMTDAVKLLAKPVTKLNQGVEDMNRFVSAYTAKRISDVGIKYGVITADDQLSYINTFVNRTNGNYIANQRPMLFQGPLGQAVGLFQTYQFNLMQQLFRYVGEGNNKSAALLMGMQGTIYGMNGLPAFNAINTHIVGNASGNTDHKDIISSTYGVAGKQAGDWLLYGSASQMLLHPDLKVNLYSRGDINPRQVTVIPTNPADVPIVGAITKLFGSIKQTASKMNAGADVYSSFLQGIEHAGISRPLAGLAQVAEAAGNPQMKSYSTTSQGSIIGANDLFSLTTFARMTGGRPLDEAIANDAVFRIRAYSAAKNKEINDLGASIKSKVQTGSMDQASLNNFMREYVQRGGKQEQFTKFMMRQMKTANVSTANQLANDLKNPVAQNMQAVMGGYRLEDMSNE